MSLQRIVINTPLDAAGFKSQCNLAPGQLPALQNLTSYLESLAGGNPVSPASLEIKVAAVQASGLLTVSAGGSVNNQACTVCNVTLTAKTSSTANNEFTISATAATQAANMAAAINASTDLAGKVTATAALGVVTIVSVVPGLMANGLQLSAGNLANTAATAFSGGTDGTAYTLSFS